MTAPLTAADQRVRTRWSDRLLPSLGIVLVVGGLILLVWYAWLTLTPGAAPYHYQLVSTGKAVEFPELELEAWPDLTINQYDVYTEETDRPVAQAYFGQRSEHLLTELYWKNLAGESVLALDSKAAELGMLAAAIEKHAPRDALLLSWWDTSRQLALLTGRDVLFHTPLYEPLIIPPGWQSYARAIRAYESEQTGTSADPQEQALFQRYTQALLNPLSTGVADLRALAGDRDAYLIVHVSDLYKLGLLYPDKFGVAYKHYRMTGNLHGMISHLKTEMGNRGYYTYTLQSLSEELIRAFFLIDEASADTLLAKLLPFTDQPSPVEHTTAQLIYQQGSYWVYRLPTTMAQTGKQDDWRAAHEKQPGPATDSTRPDDQVQ